MTDLEKAIKTLKTLIDVQCSDGNWNYNSYMMGMANGMILSLSVLDGNKPNYLSAPTEWLCDKKLPEPPIPPESRTVGSNY